MRFKICGNTSAAFAKAAEDAGIDFLGFIFFPKSPRHLTADAARSVVSALSGRAIRVGVFVDAPVAEIVRLGRELGFGVIQLHGAYPAADAAAVKAAGFEVWKVAHGKGDILPDYPCDAYLVDAKIAGMPGGTGAKSDWSLIPEIHATGKKAVLAGGLSPENIGEAMASGADVLDFNSSLESAPGVKSLDRLQALVATGS